MLIKKLKKKEEIGFNILDLINTLAELQVQHPELHNLITEIPLATDYKNKNKSSKDPESEELVIVTKASLRYNKEGVPFILLD